MGVSRTSNPSCKMTSCERMAVLLGLYYTGSGCSDTASKRITVSTKLVVVTGELRSSRTLLS